MADRRRKQKSIAERIVEADAVEVQSPAEVARKFGCSPNYVRAVRSRLRRTGSPTGSVEIEKALAKIYYEKRCMDPARREAKCAYFRLRRRGVSSPSKAQIAAEVERWGPMRKYKKRTQIG